VIRVPGKSSTTARCVRKPAAARNSGHRLVSTGRTSPAAAAGETEGACGPGGRGVQDPFTPASNPRMSVPSDREQLGRRGNFPRAPAWRPHPGALRAPRLIELASSWSPVRRPVGRHPPGRSQGWPSRPRRHRGFPRPGRLCGPIYPELLILDEPVSSLGRSSDEGPMWLNLFSSTCARQRSPVDACSSRTTLGVIRYPLRPWVRGSCKHGPVVE